MQLLKNKNTIIFAVRKKQLLNHSLAFLLWLHRNWKQNLKCNQLYVFKMNCEVNTSWHNKCYEAAIHHFTFMKVLIPHDSDRRVRLSVCSTALSICLCYCSPLIKAINWSIKYITVDTRGPRGQNNLACSPFVMFNHRVTTSLNKL